MIVDAGGGTVDISTYSGISSGGNNGQSFEEIVVPACLYPILYSSNGISPPLGIFSGSIFVTRRAESFLKSRIAYIDLSPLLVQKNVRETKRLSIRRRSRAHRGLF